MLVDFSIFVPTFPSWLNMSDNISFAVTTRGSIAYLTAFIAYITIFNEENNPLNISFNVSDFCIEFNIEAVKFLNLSVADFKFWPISFTLSASDVNCDSGNIAFHEDFIMLTKATIESYIFQKAPWLLSPWENKSSFPFKSDQIPNIWFLKSPPEANK